MSVDGKRGKAGESLSFDWALPPVPQKAPSRRAASSRPPSVTGSVGAEPTSTPGASAPPPTPTPRAPAEPTPASAASPAPASPAPEPAKAEPKVLTVAQLGRVVGRSIERAFSDSLWVEGEVSGARPAASGHVYFCMKDENEEATIDVVLYRSQVTPRGRALVKDGARVRVRGKPTYWSPRGKLQFVGDRVEPTGKGALLEALEKLKEKLLREGLFAVEKKRPLPHDPRIIGVVTSAQGAVIHDICKVAFRRGGARILLAPALVQGAGAADSVRRALRSLQAIEEVDVIVVGRGGGSQDDLLAFNDEQLVRDVAACRVPIVSAVGHEVDVTLVDFAADARAATPSQAAEMIVPDANARRRLLEERSGSLRRAIHARITTERVASGRLIKTFGDPRLLIAGAQQRIDEHTMRLGRLASGRLARERETASRLSARLGAAHPRERIARDRARASEIVARLHVAVRAELRGRTDAAAALERRLESLAPRLVREREDRVAALVGRLDAMSPLKVLARGYSIVTRADDGRAVRDASEVRAGDALHVRVGDGAFEASVTTVAPKTEP